MQQLPDDQAIKDAGSARAATIGVYDRVQAYYQLNWPVLGFLPGENVRFNGTLNQFLQIDQNQLSADNVLITEAWTQMYQAVNGANNVIAAVPGINDPLLPVAEKNQLLGEAYFLRALVYFDLGRGWGGVPLALTPTRSKANGQGLRRSTQAQTYDQVLADLAQAETLLPEAAHPQPRRESRRPRSACPPAPLPPAVGRSRRFRHAGQCQHQLPLGDALPHVFHRSFSEPGIRV